MFHKRHFTLAEANNLIEDIKESISIIIELKINLDEKGYDIYKHQYFGGFGPNGTGRFPKELERLVTLVNEISEMGIIVKDINSGLIDFPFIRSNGEEVYLCFRSGEENIQYWHSITDGFAGRRPVSEL